MRTRCISRHQIKQLGHTDLNAGLRLKPRRIPLFSTRCTSKVTLVFCGSAVVPLMVDCPVSVREIIKPHNHNVLFYVKFLQTGAHSPLENKEPKHSQNKRMPEFCTSVSFLLIFGILSFSHWVLLLFHPEICHVLSPSKASSSGPYYPCRLTDAKQVICHVVEQ